MSTAENPCPCCARPVAVCMAEIDRAGEIIATAAAAWDEPPEAVTGESRAAAVVLARQLAMAVMRHATDPPPSFAAIAAALNRKDHATAMHGIQRVERAAEDSRQKRLFRALLLRYTRTADAGTIPPAKAEGETIHT